MKKTLYILCMAMFCLADVMAQQTNLRPKMPLPGIDMSQTHSKRHADIKKQPAEKPQALYARGCNVRIVKPQQTASLLKAEAMTKKTLLTGMETIYEDAEEPTQSYRKKGTVTYNKYGHFQTIDYGSHKEQYDYVYGMGNHWTKKTVSRIENSQTFITYQELRTLDTQGRVLTIKEYKDNDYSNDGITISHKLVLTREREYDYAHNNNGMLVKDVEYDTNEVSMAMSFFLRKWFPLLQAYVECESTYSSIAELIVEDTKYTVKTYGYNYDTKKYDKLESVEEHYYTADGRDAGYYRESSFDSDGYAINKEGEKYFYTDDAPQAGYTTKVTQMFKNDEWRNSKKQEYSNNYYAPMVPDNGNRYNKSYEWNTATDKWTLTEWDNKEWTAQGNLKWSWYEDGENVVEYLRYDKDGNEIGPVYEFANGGFVLGEEGDEESIYTYYDKDGNVTRKLKAVGNDEKASATMGETSIYELKNGKWTLATGVITIGDGAGHLEAEFDNKGRMTRGNEYNSDNKLSKQYLYTYTDNGYTCEQYQLLDGTFYHKQSSGASIDADGTFTEWYIKRNIYGNPLVGHKTETYANGMVLNYEYNQYTTEFEYKSKSVNNLVTTAPDGTKTIIYRNLDDDGYIVETAKYVSKYTDSYNLDESYEKVNGKWVGRMKQENFNTTRPAFKYNLVPDPLECHDEYFFHDDDDEDVSPGSAYGNIDYEWRNNEWIVRYKQFTEYVLDGNTLTETSTTLNNNLDNGSYESYISKYTWTRDNKHNLVASTDYSEQTRNYGDGNTSIHKSKHECSYEYNSDNMLTCDKVVIYQVDGDNALKLFATQTKNYIYTPVDVVNGINTPSSKTAAFTLSGRTVTATAGSLTVHTADGTLMGQGKQVTLPTAGMYIVSNGSTHSKIVVR